MKLTDKVIVVTGSTRGIGRAIAAACAREGASVVVNSRHEQAVQEACEALKQRGYDVSGLAADVSAQRDLEALLQHVITTWGRVDVWINNAGISGGYRPLADLSGEEIAQVVNVNLIGTLRACRLVLPYFAGKPGGGILINMNGKGGRGEASANLTTYAATKAAVVNLTKSLAQEYRDSPVSIHSVLPGMVRTDFYKDIKSTPKLAGLDRSLPYLFKSFGVPVDDVAAFFVDLAAQEPGRVTGKSYSLISGSRLLRGIASYLWYSRTGKIKM